MKPDSGGGRKPSSRSAKVRGELLQDVRLRRGWTQADAARESGLSDRLLRTAERGGALDKHSIEALARVFQIPLESLMLCDESAGRPSLGAKAKEFLEQVWNHGNLTVIDTHLLPEFRFHHESGVVSNRQEMRERIAQFRTSFSDYDFTLEDVQEYGSFIVCRWIVHMTHSGPWLDLPATGRRVTVHGSSWVQVVNGKFGDAWDYWDAGLLYETLKART